MSGFLDHTPRTLLVCERSSFQDPQNRVRACVEKRSFNYKVSVLLPERSSTPDLVHSLTSFTSFYLFRKLPVYNLLLKDFLKDVVHQDGAVAYGLSYQTRIDEDNCVALLPHGRLILSLDKESFQMLGVEGRRSKFNRNRYVVSVDLKQSAMIPGSPGYLRLVTGLRSRLPLETDFLMSYQGDVSHLQSLLSSCDWSKIEPEIACRCLSNLTCPLPKSCDPHSFLEWLGAVDAGISCENFSDSYLSSLVCPEPKETWRQALSVSVCGLLLPQDVLALIQKLRSHLETAAADSWASVTVHGYADSPVSWGDDEHGFLLGGENFYNLLMFQDQTYHLHLAAGAYDACPP